MRRDPQDLSLRIPGETSQPLNIGNVSGSDNTRNRADRPLLDLSALSPTLRQMQAERVDFIREAENAAGVRVADLRKQGKSEEEIIRILNDGKTPAQIAARITKKIKSGGIDQIDSPAFKAGYQSRIAEARVNALYDDRLNEEQLNEWATRFTAASQSGQSMATIFAEIQAENRAVLGDLGYFGERTAQDMIIERGRQLEQAIRKRSNVQMRKGYEEAAQISMGAHMENFFEDAFDEETGSLIVDGEEMGALGRALGVENDKMAADTVANKDQITRRAAVNFASRLARGPGGHKAAADFLEALDDAVVTSRGFKPLQQSDSVEYERSIQYHRQRAEQTTDENNQKLSARRSGVRHQLLTTPAGIRIYEAAARGSDYLAAVRAELLDEITRGDFTNFEGIDEEDQAFLASAVTETVANELTRASGAERIEDQRAINDALSLAYTGDRESARARLESSSVDAELRFRALEEINSITEEKVSELSNVLNSQGFARTVDLIARTHLSTDGTGEGLDLRELDQVGSDVRLTAEAFIRERIPASGILEPEDRARILQELRPYLQEQFPSRQEIPTPDGGSIQAENVVPKEGQTQSEAVLAIESELRDAANVFNPGGNRSIGGINREELEVVLGEDKGFIDTLTSGNRSARRVIESMEKLAKNKRFQIDRVEDPMLGSIEKRSWRNTTSIVSEVLDHPDIPDPLSREMVGDLLGRSGLLSANEILLLARGDSEMFAESLESALPDGPGKDELIATLTEAGPTLTSFSPFAVRVKGFEDAGEFYARGAGGDVLYLDDFTGIKRLQAAALLEQSGLFETVGDDEIIQFLRIQQHLHNQ